MASWNRCFKKTDSTTYSIFLGSSKRDFPFKSRLEDMELSVR